MNCAELYNIINKSKIDLFDCRLVDDYLEITTPFVYPDGDLVNVFIKILSDGKMVVSDYGETLRYLVDSDFDPTGTTKRREQFSQTITYFGLEYQNGELFKTVERNEELFGTIFDLGQSAIRITDLLLTKRVNYIASFRDSVKTFLDENEIEYEPDYEVKAGNESIYQLDFAIRTKRNELSLLSLVTTTSPANANAVVNRTVRIWNDIRNNKSLHASYISLVDDSIPVWRPEMVKSLEFVSKVYSWSHRELLSKELA